jgi:hypothetical protein
MAAFLTCRLHREGEKIEWGISLNELIDERVLETRDDTQITFRYPRGQVVIMNFYLL